MTEKEAKRQHFIRTREKLTSDSNSKNWWWAVKRLQGVYGHPGIPTLQDASGTYPTSQSKADAFCKLFATKCTIENSDDPPPQVEPLTTNRIDHVMFRPRDIRRRMRKLDPNKATGPDNISNRILRECADCLATPIAKLFRFIFARGLFPTQWKKARVVPVHKKKSRADPANYRPISLLCNISKLMEFFVNKALRQHLFKHGLIRENQFGFRPHHSAADLLTYLSHEWMSSLNNREEVKVVALDIKAAFDRVWHRGLLAKLEARGLSGKLLEWIQNYLCDRRIQVVVGGQSSAERQINASVPQGSILGPTLFLAYIDDLGHGLCNNNYLFADDDTLYRILHHNDLAQSVDSLNMDLSHINQWGKDWKVLFAPEKCKVMSISKRRPPNEPPPPSTLYLGDTPLEECTQLDILGVTFTRNMSFQPHIDKVACRAGKRVSVLQRVGPYLDTKGRATVYKAHIRSVMEYAPLSWMSACESDLRKLDEIQHRAEKIIRPSAPLESLHHRRMVSGLGLIHRLHQPEQSPVLKSMLPLHASQARFTRYNQSEHLLQPLVGKTRSGHWSLQQFDRSAIPTMIPMWNSLPPSVIGAPQSEDTKTFCKRVKRYLTGL